MKPATTFPRPDQRQRIVVRAVGLVSVAALLVGGPWAAQGGRSASFLPMTGGNVAVQQTTAYVFLDGGVARVDPTTGATLAYEPIPGGTGTGPSLAVSRDGRSVFALTRAVENGQVVDRLHVLDGATLALQLSLPAPLFQRADAWPALAVMDDDRTVVIYHVQEETISWLTYFDRQAGRFVGQRTPIPPCNFGFLVPVGPTRRALASGNASEVHLVDVPTQRIVATTALGGPRLGNEPGWLQAAGRIPGTATIAVLRDDGRLLRVDPLGRTVTPLLSLGPGNEQVVLGAAFSGAGRAVVALAANGRDRANRQGISLVVVDLVAGAVLNRFAQPIADEGIAMTPDGRRAFLRPALDGQLVAVDLATGQARPIRETRGRPVFRQG